MDAEEDFEMKIKYLEEDFKMKKKEIEDQGRLIENISNDFNEIKKNALRKEIQIITLINTVEEFKQNLMKEDNFKEEVMKKDETIRNFYKLTVFLVCVLIVAGSFILNKETTAKDVNQSIEESKKRVDSLTEKIERLYLRTNVIGGEILFRVDRFSERKTSGEIIFSPYFYSHFNGYKLRLRVDPGGFGRAKGTHLSLFIVICKGEYDDKLSWPYKHVIKLSVVDQSTEDDHESITFSHSDVTEENKQYFNKPIDKDNIPFGSSVLISFGDLKKVTVNDVVLVRARVFVSG